MKVYLIPTNVPLWMYLLEKYLKILLTNCMKVVPVKKILKVAYIKVNTNMGLHSL